MLALLTGKLNVVDGCLYVDDSNSDTSYLLVWPPDFTLSIDADAVLLFNGAGAVVARVGEEVRFSGGEVKSVRYLDEHVRQSLPSDCPGPYWIVGDVIGPAEPPVFFIRQEPAVGLRVVWDAELIGELVVEKGCLRVDRSDAEISYLPVWPPDFTLSI